MRSLLRPRFIIAAVVATMMSSAALAQTAQPKTGPTAPAAESPRTTSETAANWMTHEADGQWRASKLIGLYVYNNDKEKIGGISDLIVDRSGKLEAVVVGAGGFLGIDQHDVAVPYSQVEWVYQSLSYSRNNTGTDPKTTGAANTANRISEGSRSYPDHAVLNMSKDQLMAAPAFRFSH